MALANIQLSLMRALIAQRGTIIGMRRRNGVSEEAMGDEIAALHRRAYLSAIGPPNQNRSLGQDVDDPVLLQHAAALLRAARR